MDYNKFASEWCHAWNDHDVERVLGHFQEDAIFTSPVAARMRPETGGRLEGKGAIRQYWLDAIALIPNLHFTVEQVFGGPDILVIQYRNQKGVRVAEVLEFEQGLVRRGYGTYPVGDDNPAGLTGANGTE